LFINAERQLTCRYCGFRQPLQPRLERLPTSSDEDETEILPRLSHADDDQPTEILPKMPVIPPPKPATDRRTHYLATSGKVYAEKLSAWAEAAYDTGLQHVRQQQWDEAIKAFKRAIDEVRDFTDAHLWIARLSEDPQVRHEHYSEVVALMPNHLEAVRELMVLNGQLTPEEAARAADEYHQPSLQAVGVPVSTTVTALRCPNCGGLMQTSGKHAQAECSFCGHRMTPQSNKDYGLKALNMALLKQRGQVVRWQVGERLLHCKSCGAERTLTAQLAEHCLFCGSRYVVEQDALQSFQQPDGVVPFRITREQAEQALQGMLESGFEKFKRFFVQNRAQHIGLEGVYVPCWFFDTVLQINRRVIDERSAREAHRFNPLAHTLANRTETFTGMANDVPVFAVDSPPRHLLHRLGRFELENVPAYEPALLATYSAQIYTLDFEQASLSARETVSEMMREKYGHNPYGEVQVHVAALMQQMLFRLVLLPVWIATVTEQDGDVRPILIHGVTAQVVAGKARRP
jgi:DNA-directed RNA polymerase subunit RPC12/RpoP